MGQRVRALSPASVPISATCWCPLVLPIDAFQGYVSSLLTLPTLHAGMLAHPVHFLLCISGRVCGPCQSAHWYCLLPLPIEPHILLNLPADPG